MKGKFRLYGGAFLNTLLFRQNRTASFCHPCTIDVVCAHPDDELAIYPILRRAHKNSQVTLNYTLFTNGTQGFERELHGESRDLFGYSRVTEFAKSLSNIGCTNPIPIKAICDEREIYELLIDDSKEGDSKRKTFMQSSQAQFGAILKNRKPDYILVNDFAGGHVIHDVLNYIVCTSVKNSQLKHKPVVLEYWQAFMQEHVPSEDIPLISGESEIELWKGKATQIIGQLGFDSQGRRYCVQLPYTGVKNGFAFYTLGDLIHTIRSKKKIYKTQERSLRRLSEISEVISLDAPAFREVLVDDIDHTRRPSHGVLYEKCGWRKRGLARLPTFNDYVRLITS
jgi:LmbE family N-acetylglucosaminyl deacetylase